MALPDLAYFIFTFTGRYRFDSVSPEGKNMNSRGWQPTDTKPTSIDPGRVALCPYHCS